MSGGESPGARSKRTGQPCAQCGQVHLRCAGHAKSRDGKACGKAAITGGPVCASHGGNARQVRQRAERRLADEKARRAAATYGLPADVEPQVAIMEEIARTNGHVLWLADVVARLEHEAVAWGETETKTGLEKGERTETNTAGAGVNVWVQLYQGERKHLVDVCAKAITLGLREREVELAQQQGELLARVIRAVIGDPELGLDAAAQGRALAVASRHLQLVPRSA